MLRRRVPQILAASTLAVSFLNAQEPNSWRDPSPHQVQMIPVGEGVRLEVLDWGGTGRPLVLLAGLGNSAHVFDDLAPKLAAGYRVYGITRRGYGASSIPAAGYSVDRLGDDVLAVVDALKLNRPVLIGHSIGGQELSSVATRYPGRVAGVVYLDAAYIYAFDDGKQAPATTRKTSDAGPPPQPPPPSPADLASFSSLRSWYTRVLGYTPPEAELRQCCDPGTSPADPRRTPPNVPQAILDGGRKYREIPVPALAIFAVPHDLGPFAAGSKFSAVEATSTEASAKAFESGVPNAKVVRLPGAHHYLFLSHEQDVLREVRAFLTTLP